MPRPKNKEELIKAANENFDKLLQLIEDLNEKEMSTPFDFSGDEKKKEAHWGRDKNVRDVLVHLYEWHQLLIQFVDENAAGKNVAFLPPLYNWKTIVSMNQMFWEKNQLMSLEEATKKLKASHVEALKRIESYTNEALFLTKAFPAVGGTTLGSYFVSNTSSHYDWAIKKIKAHKKNCKK